jgi:hypothetical protein
MKTAILTFTVILAAGCNQITGISDFEFGLVEDEGGDNEEDYEEDETETEPPPEKPTEAVGEETAYIEFCHNLTRDNDNIILKVEISNSTWSAVYHAATYCCTPCGFVPAGEPLNLKLIDEGYNPYETTFTFTPGNEYMLSGLPEDGQLKLGLANLTDENRTCDSYLPMGYSRCAGPIDTDLN